MRDRDEKIKKMLEGKYERLARQVAEVEAK